MRFAWRFTGAGFLLVFAAAYRKRPGFPGGIGTLLYGLYASDPVEDRNPGQSGCLFYPAYGSAFFEAAEDGGRGDLLWPERPVCKGVMPDAVRWSGSRNGSVHKVDRVLCYAGHGALLFGGGGSMVLQGQKKRNLLPIQHPAFSRGDWSIQCDPLCDLPAFLCACYESAG